MLKFSVAVNTDFQFVNIFCEHLLVIMYIFRRITWALGTRPSKFFLVITVIFKTPSFVDLAHC